MDEHQRQNQLLADFWDAIKEVSVAVLTSLFGAAVLATIAVIAGLMVKIILWVAN